MAKVGSKGFAGGELLSRAFSWPLLRKVPAVAPVAQGQPCELQQKQTSRTWRNV
jgi:hypothetical protein